MKIAYRFVTGEIVEVEVSQELGEVMKELECAEYNNERRETRRHVLLSALDVDGGWLADKTSLIDQYLEPEDEQKAVQALKQLTKGQRALLHALYMSDTPQSQAEYAERHGIDITSVRQQLWRTKRAIVKILDRM
jgi:DNA-directed RNA polymerase specialized sigma24 family protein